MVGGFWSAQRRIRDRVRLAGLKVSGDAWVSIPREAEEASIDLRFTAPVRSLLRRHPLQIVWSSAAQGKHMKSRPPVEAHGRKCRVQLNSDRVERLRRYPGMWKGFLYLGKTHVGEAAARVG